MAKAPLGKKKVAYLFGAGATHAERWLECNIAGVGTNKVTGTLIQGLTSRDVSGRVIKHLLKKEPVLLKRYGITEASLNPPTGEKEIDIEILISMVEMCRTNESNKDASVLRSAFHAEIDKGLYVDKSPITPRLHAALIEWHKGNPDEEMIGSLSVNYDPMYERACALTRTQHDYGLAIGSQPPSSMHGKGTIPFLKLHGSFDWSLETGNSLIAVVSKPGSAESMLWIPPSVDKDYLGYPYNLLQGRAEELLRGCDVLRVIGCSLSQNDLNLISLLFRTQKGKGENGYAIEYIGSTDGHKKLNGRLGALVTIEESFYEKPDWIRLLKDPSNHFLDWLYCITENSKFRPARTRYLNHVKKWARIL